MHFFFFLDENEVVNILGRDDIYAMAICFRSEEEIRQSSAGRYVYSGNSVLRSPPVDVR